jgi:hypothetical protein
MFGIPIVDYIAHRHGRDSNEVASIVEAGGVDAVAPVPSHRRR